MKQITKSNFRHFMFKEVNISLVNGLIWGVVVALFALIIYGEMKLALVMMAAMMANLFIAAMAGVLIPSILERMDRDPVMGSSVLLTAVTDSMGFFIFLGMAAIVLI